MPTLYHRIQDGNLDRLATLCALSLQWITRAMSLLTLRGLSDSQRDKLRSISIAALPKK